jgi:tetratricopeptide (TPR) repeat protein
LLFYLVLPLANAFSDTQLTFWESLKLKQSAQKQKVTAFPLNKAAQLGSGGNPPIWVLALPALLPLFVLSIRWPSYFGDPSKLGIALTTLIFHFFHAVLLLVCVWVALDPEKFSPRYLVPTLPLLTFYYLGAIGTGYFIGYFLLIFGNRAIVNSRPRPEPAFQPFINAIVLFLVYTLLLIVPAALLIRNLPQIRISNGPLLKQFAGLVSENLPASGAVLVSDDPSRLYIQQAALAREGRAEKFLFVDTASLSAPEYHRFLARHYPLRWRNIVAKDRKTIVEPIELLAMVEGLAKSNSVFYLHPSFGYYFERFYAEPHGLVYQFKWYPEKTLMVPPCDSALIAQNENFWTNTAASMLDRAAEQSNPPERSERSDFIDQVFSHLRLHQGGNASAAIVAAFCARPLVYWGVEMQRDGFLPQAAARFQTALQLTPDNLVAEVNLACNRNLQEGRKSSVQINQSIEDRFGKFKTWDQILSAEGPFDEPSFCFQQGRTFFAGHNLRQAAQEFARVTQLAPENLTSHLWLSRLYTMARLPEKALELIAEIKNTPAMFGLDQTNAPDLLAAEASARLANNDLAGAVAAVHAATAKYPNNEALLGAASQAFLEARCYSNALETIERQLIIDPDNPGLLHTKGYACLQTGEYGRAIEPLTRVLTLVTNLNEFRCNALLNRAIAYLKTDQLDLARADYSVLEKEMPTDYQVHFGLGEIAYLQRDTNAALRSYRLYLANAPTNTLDATNILKRVMELKHSSR